MLLIAYGVLKNSDDAPEIIVEMIEKVLFGKEYDSEPQIKKCNK